jgi:3-hydroxyacyl-[acyl-carrier-protein] dehydratase
MRLDLIDRVTELHLGRSITAIKSLSMAEEYLQDHFPRFPVMPGVMMLESMYQAAAWLVRATDRFEHSMVMLSEANNIKFSDFVEPGQTLIIHADVVGQVDRSTKLKCQGEVNGSVAVRGRLVLAKYCLSEDDDSDAVADAYIKKEMEEKFRLLYPAWISETKT